jgi:SAM-dependent methyltransferase
VGNQLGQELRKPLGYQALERFLEYPLGRCLDIGAGGPSVVGKAFTCDLKPPADFVGDYLDLKCEPFDSIWCCHVLEHQRNPGLFLDKIRRDLKPGGVLAITVPPYRDKMAGGHLFLGNEWHLVYSMVLAGFDCSKARIGVYGYNISVILQRIDAELPRLCMDDGDELALAKFFPFAVQRGGNGAVGSLNW